MVTRENIIAILKKESAKLKIEFGVKRIALFGSFAGNTQTEDSDVDIMIELEQPLGLKFFDLVDHLEKLLGKKIDVLTRDALKTLRIKEVADAIHESLLYV
jgi:predicted nucleotidyltransferase